MSKLVLWNTLGSTYEVQHSKVGPPLGITGNISSAFYAGKFGNGYTRPDKDNLIYLPANLFKLDRFTIEFWYKRTSDPTDYTILMFDDANPSSTYSVRISDNVSNGRFGFGVVVAGAATFIAGVEVGNWLRTSVMNKWRHYAFVMDADNNILNDKMRVYVDNIEITDNKEVFFGGNGSERWELLTYVYNSASRLGSLMFTEHQYFGVMDNLKIYDYAKSDFSDRFYEGYPPVSNSQYIQYGETGMAPAVSPTTVYIPGNTLEVNMVSPTNWWKLDETKGDLVIDYGSKPFNGTNVNCVINQIAASSKSCYKCDESSTSYVNIGSTTSDFVFDSSPYTICGWVKFNSIPEGGTGMGAIIAASVEYKIKITFWNDSKIKYYVSADNGSSWDVAMSALNTVPINKWCFVVVTHSNKVHTMYIDGVLQATTTSANNPNAVCGLRLGYDTGGWHPLNGFIRDVRIYNVALTREEMNVIHSSGYEYVVNKDDLPISNHNIKLDSISTLDDYGKGTVLIPDRRFDFEETLQSTKAMDSGKLGVNGTLNGGITTMQDGVFGGKCYQYNGSSGYVHLGSQPAGTIITLSLWIKTTNSATQFVLGTHWTETSLWAITIEPAGTVRLGYNNGGGSSQIVGTKVITDGIWHHVAGVVQSNGARLYVDGKLENSNTTAGSWSGGNAAVGCSLTGTSWWYNGYVDDVRIYYKTALTQQEIISIMENNNPVRKAYGVSSPTAPTETYDSEMGKCLLFNGSSNYITIGECCNFERTDEFDISFWFKATTGNDQAIFSKIYNGSPYPGWEIYINTAGNIVMQLINDTGSNRTFCSTDGYTYKDGHWHYVHCSWDINSTPKSKIYVDGVMRSFMSTDTLSASILSNGKACIGARDGADLYFNGYIKDLRIWKK